MESKGVDKSADQEQPRSNGAVRWLFAPVKLLAVVVGIGLSLVALMSVVGIWSDSLWISLGAAAAVVVIVPLVLADRALPDDGSARPGLVTDIAAMTWMGGATATVLLGTSLLHAPLHAQAARFDEHEWSMVAQGTRMVAGRVVDADAEAEAVADDEVDPAATADVPAAEATAETKDPTPTITDEEGVTPAQAPKDRPDKLSPAELFKAWAPSVVTINVESGFRSGGGTGFVIDDKGTIVTNNHVISGADTISIKLFDGTKADAVVILDVNDDDDLALLRMKGATLPPPVVLGVSADVEVGESVVVIGNPIGLEHTMTDGLVSARRVYDDKKYIQMSAPVSPGNSGGPVFDLHGDVIAVTVAKLHGENLNLAIPIDKLKPMIKSEYPAARGVGKSRW